MKLSRLVVFALASFGLLGPAWAEVRTLHATQFLPRPANSSFTDFGRDVAIDGANIILLAAYNGGQQALLYRRNTNGIWAYRRVLASVTGPLVRANVRMKNGIALVQFGDLVNIFEYSGGDYVRGLTAAPIRHPGDVAISANSILVGGDGCDYDAVVYQKGTDGIWRITGRLDDNQGECHPEGLAVELNYDYALVRVRFTDQARAWRRNGTALAWLPAGLLNVPPEAIGVYGPYALQKSTAVAPGGFVFRRTGGNNWIQQGSVVPVDYGNGTGYADDVVYRDGVLLTSESSAVYIGARPYAYLETTPGVFEHVAVLQNEFLTTVSRFDVSGRTVVATMSHPPDRMDVGLFILPTPLKAPSPIVNDFENRDFSDFTFNGGQFALAARGADDVLARMDTSGLGIALVNDTEWTSYQRIAAHITPTFSASTEWVGLVARYVDANNYYFAAIRNNNTLGLYRRLNGVTTLLSEGSSAGIRPSRVSLTADVDGVSVQINNQFLTRSTDTSLRSGRTGLATFQARADFDEVHVAATAPLTLLLKDYSPDGFDLTRSFTEVGGNWQQLFDEELGTSNGLAQLDASGIALAFVGTPVENQDITTMVRIDSFGGSQAGAWIGILARYVDARNHYYAILRNSNQLQIRKKVNGVITTLASVGLIATPRQYYELRFRVINNELQLFVNGVLRASAHDSQFTRGQYGIGTYRATATWESVTVLQP